MENNTNTTTTWENLQNKPTLVKQAKKMIIVLNSENKLEMSNYIKQISNFLKSDQQGILYLSNNIIESISYVDDIEVKPSNIPKVGEI